MASVQNEYLQKSTALTADVTSSEFMLSGRTTDFVGTIVATAVNAATTISAKIQHSHNNINWFDLLVFTSIVGVSSAEPKFVTSGQGVLTYVRSVIVLTGTTKEATLDIKLWFDTKS
jgi:hypothetical protein